MPTYSYKCTHCGHAFDIHQSFSDDSLTTCPSCQGALRKIFSPVGITFKGSGFYRTDSRATNNASSTTAKKAEASGSEKSTGSDKNSGSEKSTSTSSASGSAASSSSTSSSSGSASQAKAS